jgi:phosphoribosylformimino-5-aminoimidazole carboxamide ribotide isomerase
MIIFPAIDLRGGRVVRLEQGRADRETVYDSDPATLASEWRALGAQWIHVVDLDGAFSGEPANRAEVTAIVSAGLKVQLGGGIRSLDAITAALDCGVSRVVVGTRAALDPAFLTTIFKRFGAEHVAIGIDARGGRVAVKGWVDVLELSAADLARAVLAAGGSTVVYTDISRDGMLGGPNLEAQRSLLELSPALHVIASGGVGSLADIRALRSLAGQLPNLDGVIVGKALHDGRMDAAQLFEA